MFSAFVRGDAWSSLSPISGLRWRFTRVNAKTARVLHALRETATKMLGNGEIQA